MIAVHAFQQVNSERLTIDVPPEFVGREVEVVVLPVDAPPVDASAESYVVDRGRGPQLNDSRITVQDIWPYLEAGCSYREVSEAMPLTPAQFSALVSYVRVHEAEVRAEDARIHERNATRRNSPAVEAILSAVRQDRLKPATS